MTYQDQIKSPKWQKKRLQVLESSKFKCDECQNTEKQLHVHHTHYRKGAKIWEYDNIELRCLCDTCHSLTHSIQNEILNSLGMMEIVASLDYKNQVLGYIDGLINNAVRVAEPSEHYMQGFVDGAKCIDLKERYLALREIYGYQS